MPIRRSTLRLRAKDNIHRLDAQVWKEESCSRPSSHRIQYIWKAPDRNHLYGQRGTWMYLQLKGRVWLHCPKIHIAKCYNPREIQSTPTLAYRTGRGREELTQIIVRILQHKFPFPKRLNNCTTQLTAWNWPRLQVNTEHLPAEFNHPWRYRASSHLAITTAL